jgi:GNAT superfamily N-acetyltransferase
LSNALLDSGYPADSAQRIAAKQVLEERKKIISELVTEPTEDEIEQRVKKLIDEGIPPQEALNLAPVQIMEERRADAIAQAETQGEQNVGQTISDTGGTSVPVVGQPDTDIAAAGVRVADTSGVVPAGQDVAGVAGGKAAQPVAVTKPPIVDERGAVIPATEKGGNPIASAGFKTLDEDNNLSSDLAGATFITGMDVSERNKGAGTQLLNSITNWADENGKTLVLVPAAQPDPTMGGLSQEQLKEWYARNGFEDRVDYMVRTPPQEAPAAETIAEEAKTDDVIAEEAEISDDVADIVGDITTLPAEEASETTAPKGKRGPKGARQTPEQKAASDERRRQQRTNYKENEKAVAAAEAALNEALAPIDDEADDYRHHKTKKTCWQSPSN